ncbi:MAG: MFS transporter [Bacteroidota bacterium]
MLVKLIQSQLQLFKQFEGPARQLLSSLFIFAFFFPFFLLFSNAFIFRQAAGEIDFNLWYNLLHLFAVPIGFAYSGFLLKYLDIKTVFIAGMAGQVVNMVCLMFLPPAWMGQGMIGLFGLISGLTSGAYWAGRNYLILSVTTDVNRTFFNGLEYIFFIIGNILTPAFIGAFLSLGVDWEWFTIERGYQISLLGPILLVVGASWVIYRTPFSSPPQARILFRSFGPVWNKVRLMAAFMGWTHAVVIVLPTILVMKFIGGEAELGYFTAIAQIITLIIMYGVSSRAKPGNRHQILASGWLVLLLGSLGFQLGLISFPWIVSLTLFLALFFADPMMNVPYRATAMRMVDQLQLTQNRSPFAYLMDLEIYNALGRLSGLGLCYITYLYGSEMLAYSLFLWGALWLQLVNIPLIKSFNQAPLPFKKNA